MSRRCLLAVSLLAAGSVFAQPPQTDAPAPVIKLDVRQVLAPVIVTDKKGRFVPGLTKANFQVEEDGAPQEIVAFWTETASSMFDPGAPHRTERTAKPEDSAPPPAGVPTRAASGRIWVICFDALHTSFQSFTRTRAAIDKLLAKGHANGDRFVLMSLSDHIRVIQPATTDIAAVRSKLNSQEFTSTFTNSQTGKLMAAVNDVRRRMDSYCATCACGREASNRKSTCDVERQAIKNDIDARVEQFAIFARAFLAEFKLVVEEFAKIDGQRTLVLLSDGFNVMPGKELYATAGAYLPNSPYFKFDPAQNLQSALNESLRIATAHDIVVSAIDTRGVYSASFRPGGVSDASIAEPGATGRQEVIAHPKSGLRNGMVLEDADSNQNTVEQQNGDALAEIASATGGLFFHSDNDLLKGLQETLEDRRETYVLAYVPKNATEDGKFRHIAVRVSGAGVPEDLVVRSKSGYWAERR